MEEIHEAKLKPSTIETLLHLLDEQLEYHPSWVSYHFPAVDERGRAEYGDVENLSPGEADSFRELLAYKIRYAQKRLWHQRANSLTFLEPKGVEPNGNYWSIQIAVLREAIVDICKAYNLTNPLGE